MLDIKALLYTDDYSSKTSTVGSKVKVETLCFLYSVYQLSILQGLSFTQSHNSFLMLRHLARLATHRSYYLWNGNWKQLVAVQIVTTDT